MGATGFNRMRRLAADQMGKPFEQVSYDDAVKHIYKPDPAEVEPKLVEVEALSTETPKIALPPALALINRAIAIDELTPLPTVGKASAKTVLDNRPVNGYESIEAIAMMNPDLRCDWDLIEAYEVE